MSTLCTTNPHERSVSNGRASCLQSTRRAAIECLPGKNSLSARQTTCSAIALCALMGISGVQYGAIIQENYLYIRKYNKTSFKCYVKQELSGSDSSAIGNQGVMCENRFERNSKLKDQNTMALFPKVSDFLADLHWSQG